MSAKQKSALTGLIITLVFVSGCSDRVTKLPPPGHGYGLQNPREFRIYIYADPTPPAGKCMVDWPQATLWRNHNHTIKWVSDDGAAYTVDFNPDPSSNPQGRGNPFSGGTGIFDVHPNGETPSGDLMTTSEGYYPYLIKSHGQVCKKGIDPDPGVYVK